MADLLQVTASLMWIVLGILCWRRIAQWNRKFSVLYDDLKREMDGGAD